VKKRPTPEPEQSVDFSAEANTYYSHARWMLEWHNKRNDAFITRSVSLLGLIGVTLALLANGVNSGSTLYKLGGVRASAGVATVLLVLAALLCIRVIGSRSAIAPSVSELRTGWHEFMFDQTSGLIQMQVAEDLLHGNVLVSESPLDSAASEADARARAFKWATWASFAALLALASLFIQLVLRA